MGPLQPDTSPRGARIVRRVRGFTLELAGFVVVTALLPLLVVVALAVDSALWLVRRKPFVAIRLALFLWWFLLGEVRAAILLAWIYARSAGRDGRYRRRAVYRLRRSWATMHFAGVRVLFRLKVEVEGLDDVAPGPVTMLIRHASIIDNMVPDAFVARAHGIGFRFVIKRELQMLPLIDVAGRWVPTNFVRRGSGDTAAELEALRRLSIDLEPDEGLLIYPEGTRHTPEKLARAQEVIRERQPEVAPLADRLTSLLPPRLGGTVALLEDARGTDVVVCGHVGLDGFEYISDIWAGGLVGQTVRIRFQRFDAATVPAERAEVVRWLYERWIELDEWVAGEREHLL